MPRPPCPAKLPTTAPNLAAEPPPATLSLRAILLFDIDGVIRDVSGSYRRAITETVHHYAGWRPDAAAIDALKSEGCWNNDWEASRELLRRHWQSQASSHRPAPAELPALPQLVEVFGRFYFGGAAVRGTLPSRCSSSLRS